MKRKYIQMAALLLLSLTFSCKKQEFKTIDAPVDPSAPQIKFFNFSVNMPSVNFYANDTKVTATLSATGAEAAAGLAYGSVLPASNYATMAAGNYTFKAVVSSTATANANVTLGTVTGTLESNKLYSLYTGGFYNTTTKTSDMFLIGDTMPADDKVTVSIRLVNTISNGTEPLDLYVKNTTTGAETKVASAVAYKSASAFTTVPVGIYELYGRYPSNATTNVVVRNGTSAVGLTQGRVYTITALGDMTVSTTGTATNRCRFDNTTNR
ncbi:DUF4397 domain-containing protein [Mucilaginibacter mali]|uniref:DUF4397 domain-containing protein n=1 Tax=Mucilaginibacter mali TaxID=2740462 RepID=A0A7D4UKT4_9SPHI|nr:DUF4397 domain-containing protein [Mucilaginibacter mali]QKJ28861.1 DUF4397 domain-containing protein [Mucilaginibacter mali]